MLERIENIQGLGLLHDVNGKPFKFHRTTLIYAENGRGKSTLANALGSVALGRGQLLAKRTTIDGKLPMSIALQFSSGHKVTFTNGTWSEPRPEILVFDADFVENNVYSGRVAGTRQRQNLLEFALGAQAVAVRRREEAATRAAKDCTATVRHLADQLSGHHQGISLAAFQGMKGPDSTEAIDAEIAKIERRLVAAQDIALVLQRPVPLDVKLPGLDVAALFSLLRTSLDQVHEEAGKAVRAHLARLAGGGETWIHQGMQLTNDSLCPYCGQGIAGSELLAAYRAHFNAEYSTLKSKVAQIPQGIEARTAMSIVEQFRLAVETANASAGAWSECESLGEVPFDHEAATGALRQLQDLLRKLAAKKQANPADSVGSQEDEVEARRLWSLVITSMVKANEAIVAMRDRIAEFKRNLASENVERLQSQSRRLQLTKQRGGQLVMSLFQKLDEAKEAAKKAGSEKEAARCELAAELRKTLGGVQDKINARLQEFGASFSIRELDANFRGSAPRTEYMLELRGKPVALDGEEPSFATVLSEGDRRTLAFAFFAASTLADPEISNRVIVIDDPMSSLDLGRRHRTKVLLKEMATNASQLIVLAHDPYFVRDLKEALEGNDGQAAPQVLQLRFSTGGYSTLDAFDVDKECESAYRRHHRLLVAFVSNGDGHVRDVAAAIRLVLEGYLHRRFPGLLPRHLMFGHMIPLIENASSDSPLSRAGHLVQELTLINGYAGQFHHITNPDAESAVVIPAELRAWCQRALDVTYGAESPRKHD